MYNTEKGLRFMGIRFYCPNGHKLNVKAFQAGRRGICPYCGVSVLIPLESTRPPSKQTTGSSDEHDLDKPSPPPGSPSVGPASPQPAGQFPATAPMGYQPAMPAQPQVMTPQPTFQSPAMPAPLGPAAQPMFAATGNAAMPAYGTPMPTPGMGQAAAPSAMGPMPAAPLSPAQPAAAAPGPLDPLVEAPNAVWYVRPTAGGQYGPATADIMRAWLAEGRVSGDTLVWREGWRDWQEASAVFAQLKPDDMALFLSGAKPGKSAESRPSGAYPPSGRRASNANTALVITVLILAVVVLFVVFLMVLFQQPAAEPDRKPAPAAKTALWSEPWPKLVG